MNIYAYMECGKNKNYSEDTILVNNEILKSGYYSANSCCKCVAIADGVGGNAGGSEASEFVLSKLKRGVSNDLKQDITRINEDLISYSGEIIGKENMATTLSAVFFSENRLINLVHIGNTRIYAIQGEYLKQLTHDHTTVEYLKSRGDYEAAENAPKNEIIACLGGGNNTSVRMIQNETIERRYSGLVFTSDGIHDYLDDEEIESFIDRKDFSENSFFELNQRAVENGSSDDRSIIVLIMGE